MVLGIQKLTGASGPVDVALPPFDAAGINKPQDRILFFTLPSWPNPEGDLQEGPLQSGTAITDLGASKVWTEFTPQPWRISFWIRIPTGGGGRVLTLNNPGYLFLGSNNTDLFTINVTENSIALNDNVGYNLSRTIDLNKENTGWHHIWIEYDRQQSGGDRELYVDGRDVGWDTSSYVGPGGQPSGDGYGELCIGGLRRSTQVGLNQVITLHDLANEFDLCHLGIWGDGVNLSQVYPFFDPQDTGKLSGSYQQGNDPTPYPSIWCELDFSNNSGRKIKGYSLQGINDTFLRTANPATIFDGDGTMTETGAGGSSPISAAT